MRSGGQRLGEQAAENPSKRGGRREDHVEAEVPSPQCLFQLSHWTSLLKYKLKDKIIKNKDNDCRAFDPKCEVLSAGSCVTTLIRTHEPDPSYIAGNVGLTMTDLITKQFPRNFHSLWSFLSNLLKFFSGLPWWRSG